jgi:HEAT repeat protein
MIQVLLGLCAMLPVQAGGQDPVVAESRFHRVHLKNGNFIDGQLVKESPNEIVLKLKQGQLTIGRHLIDSVESVKIRSLTENTAKPPPTPAPGLQPPPSPSRTEAAAPGPKVAVSDEVRRKVDEMLGKLGLSKEDNATLSLDELIALGDDAAAYLASRLPDMNPRLQMHASVALGALKSAKSVPVLEELLAHPASSVRSAAVTALGNMGDTEKTRFLPRMLKDPEASVRRNVLSILSGVQDREWFVLLVDLFADEDKEIRVQALASAGQIAARHGMQDDFLRVLQGGMSRTSGPARADLLAAVGGVSKPDTWKVLTPYLRDSEPQVRAAAALALMNLGAADAGPEIADAIATERDTLARVYLAGSAQRLKLGKAVEPLIEWLADPQEEIRKVAAVALHTITSETFGTDRAKWLDWLQRRK